MKTKKKKIGSETLDAALEYIGRRDRTVNPAGRFERNGTWYPVEELSCCAHISPPCGRFPFSLMVHCRTAEHVAREYGMSAKDVKSAAGAIDRRDFKRLFEILSTKALVDLYFFYERINNAYKKGHQQGLESMLSPIPAALTDGSATVRKAVAKVKLEQRLDAATAQ
jgi:hypothetical protein